MPEMTPRAFSFNSPHGACPECQGLGAMYDFDPARLVPDESLSLADGRDRAVGAAATSGWCARRSRRSAATSASTSTRRSRKLPKKARDLLLYGPDRQRRRRVGARARRRRGAGGRIRSARDFEGLLPNLRRRFEKGTWAEQEDLERYRSLRPCPACDGERLKPQSRSVRVKGRTITRVRRSAARRGAAGRSRRWS